MNRPVVKSPDDVLICMYSGIPEPPTLNAIIVLSNYFKSVTMFRNNVDFPAESYPVCPRLVEIGQRHKEIEARGKNAIWKFARFVRYCLALRKELKKNRYKLVLLHDYLALLAFSMVRQSANYNGCVWFNSYDAIDQKASPPGRFSLMKLVIARYEAMFAMLDFFSLPAAERKQFYPVNKVKRATFVIPNFPSASFYRKYSRPKRIADQTEIKLIYQGALGGGHGFENIIPILSRSIAGRPLHLTLKGWISDAYKEELIQLSRRCDVADRLAFAGFGPYPSVPELASTCTIGLAIFTRNDIMNTTLGTASNKIYEYMAVGLPVILFDSPHFRHYLDKRAWAFFTDLSEASLLKTFQNVVDQYDAASKAAISDFVNEFNYEKVFTPALDTVIEAIDNSTNGRQ